MINADLGVYIGGVVATAILIAALITLIAFIYSYAIYTKTRLFTKPKLSVLVTVVVSILFAILLGVAIFLLVSNAKETGEKAKYIQIQAILLIVASILMLCDLIAYIVITKLNQKGKIEYAQISTIDWNAKINELKTKTDIESLKAKLSNKKYYQKMYDAYKQILIRAKDPAISTNDKIADIVLFNENFTHKWSKTNNNLQLLLTYEFCKIFNK